MTELNKKENIIFVDDETDILHSLARSLRAEPYNITKATNAVDALKLMTKKNYAVIMVDQRMPGMSGYELLEKVTGRKIFAPPAPGAMLRFFGFLGDIIKKIYPMDFPMTSESMAIVSQWPVADSSKVLATCQMNFRPGEETFKDTIGWMAKAGHLDKRLAGVLH